MHHAGETPAALMQLWGLGHCQPNIYSTHVMKYYTAFFLSLYWVLLNHKVTLGEEVSQWETFKYPYSHLLALYWLLKSNTQLLSLFFFQCFSYTEHKKPPSAGVSFSNLCEENNNAKSAGERLFGLTSSMADNRTQGSDAGCFHAPWDLGQWVLLQLSGSPLVGVCISHLHRDACRLRRPSDRNAQRHFLPFFCT